MLVVVLLFPSRAFPWGVEVRDPWSLGIDVVGENNPWSELSVNGVTVGMMRKS